MILPLPSRFFTFYSFKGGVGRTMALLNCAYILAGAGRSVLMIDFDLEAPDLSFLIGRRIQLGSESRCRKSAKNPLEKTNGLVELITAFVNSPQDWPLGQADSGKQFREDYMIELEIPKKVRITDTKGQLALLPAGRMDDSYASRLTQIDWKKPPLDKYRDDLFRHVRKLIESLDEFDYIFIDSRTGLTDGSYIAARILADHLIVLTGLNDQNIIGTANFLKHVESWPKEEDRLKEKRVILVESPVPEGEEQAKQDRHREVEELFKHHLGEAVPFSHELPYNSLLALREEAIVADWPNSSLGRAYRKLARSIQELAEDTPERWIFDTLSSLRRMEDRPKIFDLSMVRANLEHLRLIDPSAFKTAAQSAATTLADLPSPIEGDIELMQYLIDCHPDDPFYLRQLAHMQWKRKQFADARQTFKEAASIAKKQDHQLELLRIEMDFAEATKREDDRTEAYEAYQRALEIARRLNDQRRISTILYELATLDRLHGNYAAARQGIEEVLQIYQSLENKQGIADSLLHELKTLDRLQGNNEATQQGLDKIFKSLGDQLWVGNSPFEFLDGFQVNYEPARQSLDKVLKISTAEK